MIYRILSILINLIISILIVLFAPGYIVAIWILIEFLNGRHWFAESETPFDYITMSRFRVLSIFVWASGERINWAGIFVIGLVLLLFDSDKALSMLMMGLVHLIGYLWFRNTQNNKGI